MDNEDFIRAHSLGDAFIAARLVNLADQISEQGESLLQDAGLDIPSRTVSTVLLVGERGEVSTADIARILNQPHQLATQRIDLLVELGIIEKLTDKNDGRRKVLRLTSKGDGQFQRLQAELKAASLAFNNLFEELQCDLPTIIRIVSDALRERSLLDRARAL